MRTAIRSAHDPYVHEIVVERCAVAEVGDGLGGGVVGVGVVVRQLAPPDGRGGDDARADAIAHHGFGGEGSAVVVDGHAQAVVNAARSGVVGVNLQGRLACGAAE